MTLPAGTRLAPYELSAPLGSGGMGEVYRGRDDRLGRDVAVKVLPEILFTRDHKRLAILSVSTGKVRMLPGYAEGSYILDYPTWAPDGERVYFSVLRKTGDVYLLENF